MIKQEKEPIEENDYEGLRTIKWEKAFLIEEKGSPYLWFFLFCLQIFAKKHATGLKKHFHRVMIWLQKNNLASKCKHGERRVPYV